MRTPHLMRYAHVEEVDFKATSMTPAELAQQDDGGPALDASTED